MGFRRIADGRWMRAGFLSTVCIHSWNVPVGFFAVPRTEGSPPWHLKSNCMTMNDDMPQHLITPHKNTVQCVFVSMQSGGLMSIQSLTLQSSTHPTSEPPRCVSNSQGRQSLLYSLGSQSMPERFSIELAILFSKRGS